MPPLLALLLRSTPTTHKDGPMSTRRLRLLIAAAAVAAITSLDKIYKYIRIGPGRYPYTYRCVTDVVVASHSSSR